ncbi:MAG: TlpA disulfide reductase family protein [Stellaceae bacterium]
MTTQRPTGSRAAHIASERANERLIDWLGSAKPARRLTRRTALIASAAALIVARSSSAYAAPSGRSIPKFVGYVGDYFPFDTPQILPRIVFEDATGKEHDLSAMAGRIVLLNFWATWCAPCLAEMPDLDQLQAYYSGRDFGVLALCTDARSVQTVSDFLVAHGLRNLGTYFDPTGEDMHNCAISAMPTSFIIDRSGRARGILPGAAPWASPTGRALIAYYLAEIPGNASAWMNKS